MAKLPCHCFSGRAPHRAAQGWSVASWPISEPALCRPGPPHRVACARSQDRSSTMCGQAQPEVRAPARSHLRRPQGAWRCRWPTRWPPLAWASPCPSPHASSSSQPWLLRSCGGLIKVQDEVFTVFPLDHIFPTVHLFYVRFEWFKSRWIRVVTLYAVVLTFVIFHNYES
jgi:hypothetical protein